MDIIEFVEKIYGVELLEPQKEILRKVEKARGEGKKLYFIPYPPRKAYFASILMMAEIEKMLKEKNNGTDV